MTRSSLGIAIALSLATSACTGVGLQAGPTLTSQIVDEQALTSLWGEHTPDSPNGLVTLDAEHEHDEGDLWIESANAQSDWNGYGDPEDAAPRAERVLDRLTLKDAVFASDSYGAEVLPR